MGIQSYSGVPLANISAINGIPIANVKSINNFRSIGPQWSTLAGGSSGFSDGTGSAAQFGTIWGVAVDSANNVFVADTSNNAIRKVTPGGVVTTFAGQAASGYSDGVGTAAQFNAPYGVACDNTGNIFVGDYGNAIIRKITTDGTVSTFAGQAGSPGGADGVGTAAQFNLPVALAFDSTGNMFVSDFYGCTIRKITTDGTVSTFAGQAGSPGYSDGVGTAAQFNNPFGLTVDNAGNIFVADYTNNVIRQIASDGTVSTLAGSGAIGTDDGTGTAAKFGQPYGVALDSAGNIFVADGNNNRIRQVTSGGVVTTVAGSTAGFSDGNDPSALFNLPRSIASDSEGQMFVGDQSNYMIRKRTS